MSPNLQRFLPFILIIFLVLFVLPAIFHKKSSSKGPTTKSLSTETISSMGVIDRDEQAFLTAHNRYTGHIADLLAADPKLAKNLSDGIVVQLDVSTDGQTYFGQVASTVITLTRARTGAKVIMHSCAELKSSSDVVCPGTGTKTTTTAKIGTTATTTTSS